MKPAWTWVKEIRCIKGNLLRGRADVEEREMPGRPGLRDGATALKTSL